MLLYLPQVDRFERENANEKLLQFKSLTQHQQHFNKSVG